MEQWSASTLRAGHSTSSSKDISSKQFRNKIKESRRSQFSFKNIGHFFATVAGDIVKGARVVANVMQKAQKAESEIEALSSLFFPQAVELERGAFALLGLAAQAVNDAGSAAGANGINITLDQQLIADIKALMDAIEQYAKSAGVPKPASTLAAE